MFSSNNKQNTSLNCLSSLLLILLIAVNTQLVHAHTSTQIGEPHYKHGFVGSRNLVLGPNNKPVYVEVNHYGDVLQEYGEQVGVYENTSVMSGETYRGYVRRFNELMTSYPNATVELTGNGSRLINKITSGVTETLLTAPIDFNQVDDLTAAEGSAIASVMLSNEGVVLHSSENNIAFKIGFFKDDDAADTRHPTLLGPLTGVGVQYGGNEYARGVVNDEGYYTIMHDLPPCPGFYYSLTNSVHASLLFNNFSPRAKGAPATWSISSETYDGCYGFGQISLGFSLTAMMTRVTAMAIGSSIADVQPSNDLYANIMIVSGFGSLAGIDVSASSLTEYNFDASKVDTEPDITPQDLDGNGEPDTQILRTDGQIAVYLNGRAVERDEAGEPINEDLIRQTDLDPDFSNQGLLKSISLNDLKDTDIYVYRQSNNELLSERMGMSNGKGISDDAGMFEAGFYDTGLIFYQMPVLFEGLRWVDPKDTEDPFSMIPPPSEDGSQYRDMLRPGETLKTVIINRKTGYIGTQSSIATNPSIGSVDTLLDAVIMGPPNLKVRVERKSKVEAGITKGEDREQLIGFEGSGLTSDTMIVITTEWYDTDGSPLPDNLPGYTARLAKVVSGKKLIEVNNELGGDAVAQFEIQPGTHTKTIFIPDEGQPNHFYLHINGQPKERQADFATLGNTPGPLGERPKWYVPFKVAHYDENTTSGIKAIASKNGDNPAEIKPIYQWWYRPEMQFSLVDLEIQDLSTITSGENLSGFSNTQIDLTHTLTDSAYDPLTAIGTGHNYIFTLGESEIQASVDSEGVATFENIELLSQLEGADVLSLSLLLVDQHDSGNVLYEYSGLPLIRLVADTTTTSLKTSVTRTHYESVFQDNSNIAQQDFDDSYFKRSFVLSMEAEVSLILKDHEGKQVAELIPARKLAPGVVHHFALSYEDIRAAGISPMLGKDDYSMELKAKATNDTGLLLNKQVVKYTGNVKKSIKGNMLGQIIVHDVLIQNGSLSINKQDLNLPGLGPDLSFSRSYSNRSSDAGDMGQGWRHNLDITLTKMGVGRYGTVGHIPNWVEQNRGNFFNGSSSDATELNRVSISNGGQFTKVGSQWLAQRGYHGTLSENQDGSFDYRSKDGTRYHFENSLTNTVSVKYIEDRNGHQLNYAYEPIIDGLSYRNRVTSITDAVGRILNFTYAETPAGSRLTKVGGPEGIELSFTYDEHGQLAKVIRDDQNDYNENYSYEADNHDGSWNLLSATDANGHAITYDYFNAGEIPANNSPYMFIPGFNEQDLVKTVTYPDNAQPSFNYELNTAGSPAETNRRQVTDALGQTTNYYLTPVGNPRRIEEPLGKSTLMTWSINEGLPDNVMTSRTDAEGRYWQYEYDTNGNVTREIDPDNNETISSWNIYSQLLTRTDRNNNTIVNTYDAQGNLLTEQDGEQYVTSHTYNALGLRETTTSPRGNGYVTKYTYDNNGFLASELGAEGSLTNYDYDPRGRLLSKVDANGNRTEFDYDALDRLLKRTDPDLISTIYSYDSKGNKIQETSRQGVTLDYAYDERDRIIIASRSGNHITTGNKSYSYDGNGNLLTETDWKGLPTNHIYDALNRKVQTTNRDNKSMAYAYDLVDNKISVTDYEGRLTSFTYNKLDRLTKTVKGNRITSQSYDAEGNLTATIDANNNSTQYAYDGRNLRIQQTDANAGIYQWHYDQAANLVEEINENNVGTTYAYDKQNRRIQMQRSDGTSNYLTQYSYDANDNLISSIDPRGNQSSTTFDALNRPLIVTDAAGYSSQYSYSEAGRIITLTDARSVARTTEYDGLEQLIRQTQGDGGQTLAQYDANGNNSQSTDAIGSTTSIIYDALDRPVTINQQGNAVSRSTQKEYDNVGNLTANIDGRGNRTEYSYDDYNQLISTTDALNHTQNFSYDNVGNKLTEKDARGNTTRFAYDKLNRLKTVTDPLNQTLAYSYDKVGNRLTEKDKRGTVTTHTYDDLNRLTQSVKAGVTLVRNEYDGNGNITAITDANNNRSVLGYDARNLLTSTTYADNTSTSSSYDEVGNLLSETDEANQTNSYSYDNENRQLSSTNSANETTRYSYDYNGNRLSLTKPAGNGWNYSYDGVNRLKSASNSLGHTTQYEYDANDNLTAQTDAENQRVEYGYDVLNRRNLHTQIKASGNLTVSYGYDENGNLSTSTDAKGQVISYSYDKLNRETTRNYPADNGPFINIQSISTQYDANNNVTGITENKGSITDLTANTYDQLDRLLSSTQRGKAIAYTYDNNGNRTGVSTSAGSTSYSYDTRNRIKTANAGGITSYSYYADGKKQSISYPNGTQSNYSYDAADRVNDISTSGQGLISQYQYNYDSNGNRLEQIETQNGQTETTSYSYDGADRMQSYTLTAGANITTTTYTFDSVSNRLSEVTTENAVTTTDKAYSYDETHWLQSVTDNLQSADIIYSYDANGNTIQKVDNTQPSAESTVFVYNARDQLVQTQRGPPAGETQVLGQYDYNHAGLRTRHYQSERGNINYYYDDQAVIEERTETDTLLAHYRYADRLLSLQTSTDTSYYHQDALGSTTNLTDNNGATQVSYKLDPWGHVREQVGTSVNRQIFTGQETDEKTGLIYFGARFYDPDVARFINQDSYLGEAGEPPSLHRYLYAFGNPTVWVDPTGNVPVLNETGEFLTDTADKLIDQAASADSTAGAIGYGVLAAGNMALGGIVEGVNFGLNILGSEGYLGEGVKDQATEELHQAFDAISVTVEDPSGTYAAVKTSVVETTAKAANGEKKAIAQIVATAGSVVFAGKPNANIGAAAGNVTKAVAQTSKNVAQGARNVIEKTARALEPSGGYNVPDIVKAVTPQLKYNVVPDGGKTSKNISPDIKALSEANITDNGITVLGRFQVPPGQINYIQKATTGKHQGSSYFDLGDAWTPIEGKAANQHFLNIIGERGDKVIFSTPKGKIPTKTSLDMEVEYLKENFGYKWVNQWSMRKK